MSSMPLIAQVAIGKDKNGPSVLLDFNDVATNTNGIILPAVKTKPVNAVNGTFIYDVTTEKIQMLQNDQWIELSAKGDASSVDKNNSNEVGKGVIIGSSTTAATGVLVLESDSKAMVLPKIANPDKSVIGAYPGMVCYDTVSQSIAVYDGLMWNYWK